jgi:hypothetical protein
MILPGESRSTRKKSDPVPRCHISHMNPPGMEPGIEPTAPRHDDCVCVCVF